MKMMTVTYKLHQVNKLAGVRAVELLTQMHAEVLDVHADEATLPEPAQVLLVGLSFEVAQLIHAGQCPQTGLLDRAWVEAIHCAYEDVIDPDVIEPKPHRPQ